LPWLAGPRRTESTLTDPRFAAALLAAAGPASAQAQTLCRTDPAEILSGARFDFKVNSPGAPAGNQVEDDCTMPGAVRICPPAFGRACRRQRRVRAAMDRIRAGNMEMLAESGGGGPA
jgi:hypothetical protein